MVGTVILFGFLILALASYQAFAVPAQNNAAEFEHSQDVQSDMQDLRASLLDVRDARENPYQRPVRVGIGFRYDSRLFAVNPSSPEGALTTQDRGPVDIRNARVDPGEANRFENTEPLFDQTHDTLLLSLRPGYNEYQNPPRTTFEHSLLYNRFEGANRTITGQRTIDGEDRQLSLVTYSDDIDRQGLSTTIDPETVDGPTPTVPIEGENSDPFSVTLPTHSPAVWTDLIGDDMETGESNARVVDTTTQSVTVELSGTWDLQMARVGYEGRSGDETPFSNVTVQGERDDIESNRTFNVSWHESEPVRIIEEQTANVEVKVTDRDSGNPIQDARIDASFARIGESGTLTIDDDLFSNESGTADVGVNAGEADAGDIFELYASAGDDVDQIEVRIDSPSDETGLTDASVSNIPNQNNRDQTFTATLADDLAEEETVTIDLSNPDSDGVDYSDATVDTVSDGSAEFTADDELTLTATDGEIVEDTQVTIDVSGVDARDVTTGDQFDVAFERSDADTALVRQFEIIDRGGGE